MRRKSHRLSILIGLLTILAISFSAAAVQTAHAAPKGRLDFSTSLTPDGKTLVVKAWAWGLKVETVRFHIEVSISDQRTKPNKPHTHIYEGDAIVPVQPNGYAEAIFLVPFKGTAYYLYEIWLFNAADGTLLAYKWVDPREGTGP